jgi:hypothetical protein
VMGNPESPGPLLNSAAIYSKVVLHTINYTERAKWRGAKLVAVIAA